jgi:hypothetical protein
LCPTNLKNVDICYLCGQPLGSSSTREHVIPKQFFPENLRKELNPDLIVLTAHGHCNQSYMLDEEYFYTALGPHALDLEPVVGQAIHEDLKRKFKNTKKEPFLSKIRSQITTSPSGLILPPGMCLQKFGEHDYARIKRVVWKITRGCFFVNNDSFLPENKASDIQIYLTNEELPNEVKGILTCLHQKMTTPDYKTCVLPGCRYPRIFDYEFVNGIQFNCLVFIFWNCIWAISVFYNPDFDCEKCSRVS